MNQNKLESPAERAARKIVNSLPWNSEQRERLAKDFSVIVARAIEESRRQQDDKIKTAYEGAAEHWRNRPHKTIPIEVWADVDEGIADLVLELNEIRGLRTDASCQGTEKYRPYVMATWNREIDAELREKYELEYLGEFWGYIRPKDGGSNG